MPITFVTLKVVFVLARTIGDASSLSCQSLYQSRFVCSMSSSIVAQSKLNTAIRCGANKKVGKEPPWSFGFLHLPFLPLQSGPSLVDSVCTELFWKLSGCGDFSFCNQNHCFFMDSGKWTWWLLCASAGRSSG